MVGGKGMNKPITLDSKAQKFLFLQTEKQKQERQVEDFEKFHGTNHTPSLPIFPKDLLKLHLASQACEARMHEVL
jgi:hypothetical protein